jgi:hypothetical protein
MEQLMERGADAFGVWFLVHRLHTIRSGIFSGNKKSEDLCSDSSVFPRPLGIVVAAPPPTGAVIMP